MISNDYLSRQIDSSRADGRTTLFLRNLAIFVVRSALRRHYGENYSIRCLQASLGFKRVLERIGLKSDLWTGDVCFAQAFASPPFEMCFSGFWDKDHHIWLLTEFKEIVDLTIGQLHRHPASTRSDALEIPALWWDDISRWPATIRYLPSGRVTVQLPETDAIDLSAFELVLNSTLDGVLEQLDPDDIPEYPLLHGPSALNELHSKGHPWVTATADYQTSEVPLPDYMSKREQELMNQWSNQQGQD